MDKDFDRNLFVDLVETMLDLDNRIQGKYFNGYVQVISMKPFQVVLVTEEQINLLRDILKVKPEISLCLDATGRVTKSLPFPFSESKCLYYCLVVQLKNGLIPVGEFISNDQTAGSIQTFLDTFIHL